jgi:uncharacterized protein YbjQ (UPF0145 family)
MREVLKACLCAVRVHEEKLDKCMGGLVGAYEAQLTHSDLAELSAMQAEARAKIGGNLEW